MRIEGVVSGDCECWCFLVDKETFIKVKGQKPGRFDVGRFAVRKSPYRYMIYPDNLIVDAHDGKPIDLTVIARKIK